MFSVTKTPMNDLPLCTLNVCPTKSGVIVERRDQVLIGFFDPDAGQTLADLLPVNFVYGANATGKTTISRVIHDAPSFPSCTIEWAGAPLETLVYNRDFVERNFNQPDELKGISRASLVSAAELSSETVEKIRATLSKKTGKDIILDVEEDPGLIGGIVTRIGDLVLDGSIKTQLLNMRESLKRGEGV